MGDGPWDVGLMGGQTEYVRVPYADQGLNLIPDSVSDEQALFVGDILLQDFGLLAFRRFRRRHGACHWCGTYGNLYFALCDAEETEAYHCL